MKIEFKICANFLTEACQNIKSANAADLKDIEVNDPYLDRHSGVMIFENGKLSIMGMSTDVNLLYGTELYSWKHDLESNSGPYDKYVPAPEIIAFSLDDALAVAKIGKTTKYQEVEVEMLFGEEIAQISFSAKNVTMTFTDKTYEERLVAGDRDLLLERLNYFSGEALSKFKTTNVDANFLRIIEDAMTFALKGLTDHMLEGVHFRFSAGHIVATNGHVLYMNTVDSLKDMGTEYSTTVHCKELKCIVKAASKKSDACFGFDDDRRVLFSQCLSQFGDESYVQILAKSESHSLFVDYTSTIKSIINGPNRESVIIKKDGLKSAVATVKTIALLNHDNSVAIEAHGDTLSLVAQHETRKCAVELELGEELLTNPSDTMKRRLAEPERPFLTTKSYASETLIENLLSELKDMIADQNEELGSEWVANITPHKARTEALVEVIQMTNTDIRVRALAAKLLFSVGETSDLLFDLYKNHMSKEVRLGTMLGLAKRGEYSKIKYFTTDPSKDVSEEAYSLLEANESGDILPHTFTGVHFDHKYLALVDRCFDSQDLIFEFGRPSDGVRVTDTESQCALIVMPLNKR